MERKVSAIEKLQELEREKTCMLREIRNLCLVRTKQIRNHSKDCLNPSCSKPELHPIALMQTIKPEREGGKDRTIMLHSADLQHLGSILSKTGTAFMKKRKDFHEVSHGIHHASLMSFLVAYAPDMNFWANSDDQSKSTDNLYFWPQRMIWKAILDAVPNSKDWMYSVAYTFASPHRIFVESKSPAFKLISGDEMDEYIVNKKDVPAEDWVKNLKGLKPGLYGGLLKLFTVTNRNGGITLSLRISTRDLSET
jgi:hypothetical protein